ncbi:Pyrroline-5-carboxylate reductase catalytic N-terminal [Trinorchestia longiramus]|nr:Pyrroline-5-carboxylate reductase catalytic N-terminal [Trinorchestia longiramus]
MHFLRCKIHYTTSQLAHPDVSRATRPRYERWSGFKVPVKRDFGRWSLYRAAASPCHAFMRRLMRLCVASCVDASPRAFMRRLVRLCVASCVYASPPPSLSSVNRQAGLEKLVDINSRKTIGPTRPVFKESSVRNLNSCGEGVVNITSSEITDIFVSMENLAYGPDPSDPLGSSGDGRNPTFSPHHNGAPKQHKNGVYRNGIPQFTKNPKNNAVDPEKIITVLGSGDYGRALSGRLVKSGYTVYIGSRDPTKETTIALVKQTGAILLHQDEALAASNMVVVAVGRDYYDDLPLARLKGKILIDVANNTQMRKGAHYRSNAEYLQGLVPEASVVKGFNVLSAYALENGGLQGSKEVFIAGNDPDARAKVALVVRACGFTPVDWGMIKAARDIEDIPLKLMPSWKKPVAVVFGLFVFVSIIALFSFQICRNIQSGDWTQNWTTLFNTNFNRVIAVVALWTLAFCYLPGLLAAYLQLWRGTKFSRFPTWLDNWLRMRKQLGLLMLGLAATHACMSVAYVTPQTLPWVYEPATKIRVLAEAPNGTLLEQTEQLYNFHFNWRGELFLTVGALAMCLTVVLGITSLPSVTATMSWREFTFIQSKLGWVCLILASFHDIFLAWNYMFLYFGCFNTLPIGPQYALYPSALCVLLKLPLLLPCVDNHLQKIRRGYERSSAKKQKSIA